jgi:uncharacterized membrane protein HdeD (DUF308 family)
MSVLTFFVVILVAMLLLVVGVTLMREALTHRRLSTRQVEARVNAGIIALAFGLLLAGIALANTPFTVTVH